MGIFVVTGAASGIGLETAAMLRADGHEVIGVDLRNAEIEADLSRVEGRDAMVRACEQRAPSGIDGLVAAAGIADPGRPAEEISINYFGAVATATGLRPLLAKTPTPSAVMVGSTACLQPFRPDVVAACLAGDEQRARSLAVHSAGSAYCDSKQSVALWMRRAAIGADWGGQGILLNAVSPGIVVTPMTSAALADPEAARQFEQGSPAVLEGYARPQDIAEVILFLLTQRGRRMVGQMIFVDAGADALMRTEQF